MSSLLGNFQSTTSAGFIFGCIAAPLLVIGAVVYLYFKGFQDNMRYRYGKISTIPKIVWVWRMIVLCFCIATLTYQIATSGPWALSYFTVWNWMLVLAYFIVGTASSSSIVLGDVDMSKCPHGIPKYVQYLQAVHQIMGEVEVPCAWLVTLVVWAYLGPSLGYASVLTFTSIAQHIFNSILMTIDFILADYLVNPHHFAFALIWPGLYVIWHLIGNVAYGLMCYPFMKTDNPAFIGWFFGLALVCVGFFFLAYLVSRWKSRGWCSRREDPVEDDSSKSTQAAHNPNQVFDIM